MKTPLNICRRLPISSDSVGMTSTVIPELDEKKVLLLVRENVR
jgi:hypothetical protein